MRKEHILVAPSALSADFMHLHTELELVSKADFLHIDVMDAHFAPNLALGTAVIQGIYTSIDMPLDMHFMVDSKALHTIAPMLMPMASIATVHIDDKQADAVLEEIEYLRSLHSCNIGIAINPNTHIDKLIDCFELFADKIDLVLVMGVMPGFSGQQFIPETIDRVAYASSIINRYKNNVTIEVDGGVSIANARKLVDAGANMLVAGNAIFKARHPDVVVADLQNSIVAFN